MHFLFWKPKPLGNARLRVRATMLIFFTLAEIFMLPAGFSASTDQSAGGYWEPRPLIDTQIPKPVENQSNKRVQEKSESSRSVDPLLEARLKPVEPFIQAVEKRLSIRPQADSTISSRLYTLQSVLYGEPKYTDAGALLVSLAEIFPAEAAKAKADLDSQLPNRMISPSTVPSQAGESKTGGKNQRQRFYPAGPKASGFTPGAEQKPLYGPSAISPTPSASSLPAKRKFWQTDFDADFDSDPFFNDSLQRPGATRTEQLENSGTSRIAQAAQGLSGLAWLAGAVAGNYFLNKNAAPNSTMLNNNGYYPGYSGYSPYPYSGQSSPYGIPYASMPYSAYGSYNPGYSYPLSGNYGAPYTVLSP